MDCLPSTTRVGRRIAKEDFYRRLNLTAKQREAFIRQVESITIAHSIKQSTMHIESGQKVHEIFVVELALKEACVPETVIEAIAKTNPHQILFQCGFGDDGFCAVYRMGRVWCTEWLEYANHGIELPTGSLDRVWESLCGQVIFGNGNLSDVDSEIRRRRSIESLSGEIAKLEKAHGRERQMGKRNELFKKLQEARSKRDELLKG